MVSRETALRALLDRVRRASADDDPRAFLSDQAEQEATELAAATDPDTDVEAAALLGMFHWGRYLALPEGHDQTDFEAAAKFFTLIYRTTPEIVPVPVREHYERPHGRDSNAADINMRALGLLNDYNRTQELSGLIEAITLFRAAMAAADDDPDRCRYASNLGAAMRMLGERTGNVSQLAEAVEIHRAAAADSHGHPDRHSILFNFGVALGSLSDHSADIALLAEAAQVGREAVAAAPRDYPDRGTVLSGLGAISAKLAGRTGNAVLLGEAVIVHRSAVAATPEGHPYRRAFLSNLGGALQGLSEWTGDTTLLAEAAKCHRTAATAIPSGHPDRAGLLSNLGSALIALSERSSDADRLTQAIEVQRAAAAAADERDPHRAMYLSNLGSALQMLSERTGDAAPLRDAMQAHRDAVEAVPASHADRPGYLFNLGNALQALGQQAKDARLLAEAATVHREGVAASLADRPDYARGLFCLGSSLEVLSEHNGDRELLAEARTCYEQSAGNPAAPAPDRIKAYYQVARLAAADTDGDDALAAMEAAVSLLPQIAPRTLAREDRSHRLGMLAGLAGTAAATAVGAGRPSRAIELLEQTRGILVADTLQARSSSLNRLRRASSALAAEFERLRDRLDALDSPMTRNIPLGHGALLAGPTGDILAWLAASDAATERHEAQAEWDELLSRIRAQEGLADFLAAPGITELVTQTSDGPVVFVYTSPARCGALALTRDPKEPVRAIPLDDLSEDKAHEQVTRLLGTRGSGSESVASRAAAQEQLRSILAWMWDAITGPVLAELGYTTTPAAERWPRLWWCPVGLLAYLPLHASGHHSDLTGTDPAQRTNPRTVLDRVISSYTPTLRGLAYARTSSPPRNQTSIAGQEAPPEPITSRGTVIVAVPEPPGVQPLPGVSAEAEAVATLVPDAEILADPTRDRVLDALTGHTVVHFACHGYANWANPAASELILPDHETTPLTVADITDRRAAGDLAYLSACDTMVTSHELADESVHLTGAFHLTGYRNVIGTLWPISDRAAIKLANDFYSGLTHEGTSPPDTQLAASALHNAVRNLRALYLSSPALWASHTHTGI